MCDILYDGHLTATSKANQGLIIAITDYMSNSDSELARACSATGNPIWDTLAPFTRPLVASSLPATQSHQLRDP